MGTDFVTNQEIVLEARRHMSETQWAQLTGGSESETTMRRNRLALDRWAFRPRVLRDVSHVDPSTTFMGEHLRIPVILAPVGGLQSFYPNGDFECAEAASRFGTVQVLASGGNVHMEKLAATGEGPKVFQLYTQGDDDWVRGVVERVQPAGYMALCLTVDVAIYSRRERAMMAGSSALRLRTDNRMARLAYLTWDEMDRIREIGKLPFLLKGVATADDARMAIEHGVDVIWVSNHGGRQLDHGRGALDVLPEIVEAVAGRAEIVIDGSILRGTDVLKAVALGAKAVAIGKLQGWGVAAAGAGGVHRVLEILEDEMRSAMGLLGITSLDELDASYLRRAEAVNPPHEMSAWPNIPAGRLL